MSHQQTLAVVLSVADFGESDKIVTFFAPRTGRMTGIAKGAKRSKRRFVNKLEPFTLLDLFYCESGRSSMVRLEEAELLDSFMSLRESYGRYSAATLLCSLTIAWTREHDGSEDLFALLVWSLRSIAAGDDMLRAVILFNVRLLRLVGYQPHLAGCLVCMETVQAARSPYMFSIGRGGLVCSRCRPDGAEHCLALSLPTLKLLDKAQELPLEKLNRLYFSDLSRRQALSFLQRFGSHLLQRDIHPWKFLDTAGAAPR